MESAIVCVVHVVYRFYIGLAFFPIFIHVLVLLVHVLLLLYGCCYRGYDRNVAYNPIMDLSLCYTNDSRCYNHRVSFSCYSLHSLL